MTDLVQFGAAVLAQWRNEGGSDKDSIAVAALVDRVLPYRVARKTLGIEMSEDYEALMLRLLAQEEDLVSVMPPDAAELARTTAEAKLPDLGVLQLLRPASITFTKGAIKRFATVAVAAPAAKTDAAPETLAPQVVEAAVPAVETGNCWSCDERLPTDRDAKFCPFCGADQRQPSCKACGARAERGWKHCPDCGSVI